MTQVLFVTTEKTNLEELSLGMELSQDDISWASSGEAALEIIKNKPFDLVVSDEKLADMTGLKFIENVVKTNPMINTAAVSSLSADDYHEASEGLGVLKQLPVQPSQADGKNLMEYLRKILGFSAGLQ